MRLLEHLLAQDPAAPRLSIYDGDTRLDFSAQTLDNWAAKVANMLREELELSPGDAIAMDLPCSWQAVVVALGCVAAEVSVHDGQDQAVLFAEQEPEDFDGDLVLLSRDPFGRGIEETGGTLAPGAIDFGPTVRVYGDVFPEPGPRLDAWTPEAAAERVLVEGWENIEGMRKALAPMAAGGSVVVVIGGVSQTRLDEIARAERVERRIEA
ncbi:TIGR03089 family protein [Corynebacterium pelargi]|uniref:TIGR03089 family protein n=1 Tax=Corynebacterium pelargi TaxID=1471400 RepID=A0A410WAG1_9CORY|nr:TIGR03089 family protein [Corynebacterium pelargi]QAU52942.1 hypothetical protein CPELA_08435 [Corynebacterium pelargi]GGG75921.1 hypothetical protein GCM10007338_11920 [Corynebacterium pelargi]